MFYHFLCESFIFFGFLAKKIVLTFHTSNNSSKRLTTATPCRYIKVKMSWLYNVILCTYFHFPFSFSHTIVTVYDRDDAFSFPRLFLIKINFAEHSIDMKRYKLINLICKIHLHIKRKSRINHFNFYIKSQKMLETSGNIKMFIVCLWIVLQMFEFWVTIQKVRTRGKKKNLSTKVIWLYHSD